MREAWPRLEACLGDLPPLRIAVAATYTVDTLVPYLGCELAPSGLALHWTPVPFNQVYPQLLRSSSELRAGGRDVAVLLPRIEELLSHSWEHLPADPLRAREIASAELENLVGAIGTFLSGYEGLFLAGNFVRPELLPLGLLDASSPAGGTAFTEWLNQEWRARLSALPSARILDVAGTLADEGHRQAADLTRWYLGRIPFRETAVKAVAALIARYVRAWQLPTRKVIVLDCDGTLWGGIVGEDGPGGVAVGEGAPGNAYAAFQGYVAGLQRRGILVALCSKNNEEDVWGVFAENPGMVLKKADLAAWRINWSRKSENLRAIAKDLNVGIDSLVMVDDSPVECAEVQANAPEMAILQLPEDPAEFVVAVESSGLFDTLRVTSEDQGRSRMYVAERQRDELRKSMGSLDDYLRTLDLAITIFTPLSNDLPRVAQLIQRTNQFNLTTRRRTEGELRALGADPAVRLYAVRVRDRFGEYGLAGAAIIVDEGDRSSVDTFLLSCRVLARGVEDALLRRIVDDARSRGFTQLRAQFVPTSKNMPAAAFLDSCGFGSKDSEGWQTLVLSEASLPEVPHIAVEASSPDVPGHHSSLFESHDAS